MEVLKGNVPPKFTLPHASRNRLGVQPRKDGAGVEAGHLSLRERHESEDFWFGPRAIECPYPMRPNFIAGEAYLFVLGAGDGPWFARIRDEDDLWYRTVKASVTRDPSFDLGREIAEAWIGQFTHVFVGTSRCNVGEGNEMSIVTKHFEAPIPNEMVTGATLPIDVLPILCNEKIIANENHAAMLPPRDHVRETGAAETQGRLIVGGTVLFHLPATPTDPSYCADFWDAACARKIYARIELSEIPDLLLESAGAPPTPSYPPRDSKE
jgi:hypothetical protein